MYRAQKESDGVLFTAFASVLRQATLLTSLITVQTWIALRRLSLTHRVSHTKRNVIFGISICQPCHQIACAEEIIKQQMKKKNSFVGWHIDFILLTSTH